MQRAPSTPKTRKGGERREQIINAAMEAFAAHGSGACRSHPSPAVGISEQGVMRYVPTKVPLLLGTLERGQEQDTELFNALSAEGLTVLEILSEFARLNRERLTLQSVLMAESVDPAHTAHAWFASRNERVRRDVGLALAAAQRDGTMRPNVDPDTLAAQLLSTSVGWSWRTRSPAGASTSRPYSTPSCGRSRRTASCDRSSRCALTAPERRSSRPRRRRAPRPEQRLELTMLDARLSRLSMSGRFAAQLREARKPRGPGRHAARPYSDEAAARYAQRALGHGHRARSRTRRRWGARSRAGAG